MKIILAYSRRHSRGYALLLTLFMAAISIIILTATMNRTASDSTNNERSNQYNANLNAAEAATELVVAQMRSDYPLGGDARITNHLTAYRASVPASSDNAYWNGYQFSDGQGNTGGIYVNLISNRTYRLLSGQYAGLSAWAATYRVLANAQNTAGAYPVTAAVQQDVDLNAIPVFQFAIFFNGLLEFTWAATLNVRGRTHANGNIFVGSSANLTFSDLVTTTGVIAKTNWAGHTVAQYTGTIGFATNVSGGYTTNNPSLNLPIGTNMTATAVREIINMPPAGEAVTSSMGQLRFYNLAGMDLLVSNATVTAIIKNAPTDPSPVTITALYSATNYSGIVTNFPFLTVTNQFTDQRESKTVLASQIDIGVFNQWMNTNTYTSPSGSNSKHPTGNPLNILYVADNRTMASTQMAAVRLTNGIAIPTNGLTLATPNPMYILGNFNCTNSAYLGTTNTSATSPASILADALTILSPNWQDSQSGLALGSGGKNAAVSTTVNAAMIAGMVYTQGSAGTSPFSGGVVNYPRLLEDWGNGSASVVLTLNTSIVNLYNSVYATGAFQNPGAYYYAPTRNFNFDQNFLSQAKLPPGTPQIAVLTRSKWTVAPSGRTDYYGN